MDAPWHANGAGCRKEEFVILSSVQCQVEADLAFRFATLSPWNPLRIDLRSDAAFFANVGQIGREAVADIDHRAGKLFFPQNAPNFNPWLGEKVSAILLRIQL